MNTIKVKHIQTTESDGSPYSIPYWEIDSGRPGPRVMITAALHGTEINGCEIIRRFMPIARRNLLKGSCLLLPFANLGAIRRNQPHIEYEQGKQYGGDRMNNINCTWPGDPAGSSSQRATAAMKAALVDDATHNIDLHSWNHTWAAAVLARSDYPPSLQLAQATGLRFARHFDWMPEKKKRPVTPCTLTSYFNDTGRAAICIEFSGQNIINPAEVRSGLRAVQNCLRLLKMLPGKREKGDIPQIWINKARMTEVKAPCSGMFISAGLKLAAPVKKGTLLGYLFSDETLESHAIRAPVSGYLYRYGCLRVDAHDLGDHHKATHPYAATGEFLASILS